MNVLSPISSLMSTDLITVNPGDSLAKVKEKFDSHNIHHLPVVHYKEIIGMISDTDLAYFLRGSKHKDSDQILEDTRLRTLKAEDIMTTKMAKVESTDQIRTALEVFKINRFHALPVVDKNELVGIITTHDIISALADAPISLGDYKKE